jgi:hypothetical protein
MRTRFISLFLSASALVACTAKPSRVGSEDAGSPVEASAALASAICDVEVRCTSGQGLSEPVECATVALNVPGQRINPSDLTWVQNGPTANSLDTLLSLQDSIHAGLVTVEETKLGSCIRGIRALGCNAIPTRFTQIAECAAVFTGRIAKGGRCISTPACVTGTICQPPMNSTVVACEGTCETIGVVCRDDDDCDPTTSCSGGECKATVKPAGAEGQPCGSSFNLYTETRCQPGLACTKLDSTGICERPQPEGGACWNPANCAAGLDCVTDDMGNGLCHSRQAIGEGGTCFSYDPLCAPGLRCIDGVNSGKCLTVKGKGDPCQSAAECGHPQTRLVCDATAHRCVDEPTSGPCPSPSLPPAGGCDARVSYCRSSDLTCQPFLDVGAACTAGIECGEPALGRYCNPGSNGGCALWPPWQRCAP